MFEGYILLKNLNISNFSLNKIKDVDDMLNRCYSLKQLNFFHYNITYKKNLEEFLILAYIQ